MVAGRGGNYAFGPFFGGELADFIVSAAQLEGAGMLEVFGFQVDFVAGQFREKVAFNQAGFAYNAFKVAGGLIDAGDGGLLDNFGIIGLAVFFLGHNIASSAFIVYIKLIFIVNY